MRSPSQFPVFGAAAFLTGVAALSYEVGWARLLVVVLGNSLAATSIVLAALMVGLSVGGWLFGSVADRVREPLRLYGTLELLLGGYALAVPTLVKAIGGSAMLAGSFQEAALPAALRFLLAFLVVAVPALVMGATLPVMVRGLDPTGESLLKRVGVLYGLNTLGGAAGAALTGFIGVPLLGVRLSTTLAAALNVAAALLVLSASRRRPAVACESAPAPIAPASPHVAAASIIAVGAVGCAMLSLETLWSRILSFIFGYDTYAFSMLLVVVLLGLGVGGLVHRLLTRFDQGRLLTVLLGLFPVAVLASLWAAAAVFPQLEQIAPGLGQSRNTAVQLRSVFLLELMFTPVLVFLPALVSGAIFPAACAFWSGPGEKSGSRIGALFLVNGVGCMAGALATPFVITPLLGIQNSIVLAALLGAVAALAVSLLVARPVALRSLAIPGASLAGLVLLFAVVPEAIPRSMLLFKVGPKHQEVLHYEEGPVGTVSVVRNRVNGDRFLLINSIIEVSTRLVHDQSFKLLGHLGFLLHPQPRTALAISLGGGLSAGAAILHDPARLDMVEIDPAVPGATRLFARENNNVLDNPAFHLHLNDGRQFLAGTASVYDIIFIDSTHPKATDSWVLYTREFYRLVREHLGADGLVVQWVPVHGMSEQEFKIIVRTFLEAFPDATFWVNAGFEVDGGKGYVKMVGGRTPLRIDYGELARRLAEPRIAADLEPFGMNDPAEILDCFLAGPQRVRAWTAAVPVQTDDNPIVPYITRYSEGPRMSPAQLGAVREPVLPYLVNVGAAAPGLEAELRAGYASQGMLLAGRLDRAAELRPAGKKIRLYREQASHMLDYQLSLADIYRDDPTRLTGFGEILARHGLVASATGMIERALSQDPGNVELKGFLGTLLVQSGNIDRALRLFAELLENDPGNVVAAVNLALARRAAGDVAGAEERLNRVLDRTADATGEIRFFLAEGHAQAGRFEQAETALALSTARNPDNAQAWFLRALVAIDIGRPEIAVDFLSRVIELDPFQAPALYFRGAYSLDRGQPRAAIADFDRALEVEGGLKEAYDGRARALLALGNVAAARADAAEARRLGHPIGRELLDLL